MLRELSKDPIKHSGKLRFEIRLYKGPQEPHSADLRGFLVLWELVMDSTRKYELVKKWLDRALS